MHWLDLPLHSWNFFNVLSARFLEFPLGVFETISNFCVVCFVTSTTTDPPLHVYTCSSHGGSLRAAKALWHVKDGFGCLRALHLAAVRVRGCCVSRLGPSLSASGFLISCPQRVAVMLRHIRIAWAHWITTPMCAPHFAFLMVVLFQCVWYLQETINLPKYRFPPLRQSGVVP